MRSVKLLVAGGRDFSDVVTLEREITAFAEPTDMSVSIVSGMARGADMLAYNFAKQNNVQVHCFKADWNLGRHAGFLRNEDMGRFADELIAFWDGQSKGTAHMIQFMQSLGKPVKVIKY